MKPAHLPVAAALQSLLGGAHAPLSCSSSPRWWHCPGSVYMSALYPEVGETEKAREGTAGHWAAEEEASGRGAAVGQVTPEGWVLDADQIEGAELFANHLPRSLMRMALLEQRLSMAGPKIFIHQHCWGTSDLSAVDHNARRAYISDYKYGHGLVVTYRDPQLMLYGAGLANRIPAIGPGWTFEFAIVQPRVWHRDGHVRRWVATYEELEPLWTSLSWAAEEAMSDDPRLQTGAHCRHCPARHACPALNNDVSNIAPRLEQAAPLDLPDHAMGFELAQLYQMQTLLNSRISGLETEAEMRIRAGHPVPGLMLESKPGREKWKSSDKAIVDIGRMYGLNLAKDVKAATPNQARSMGMDPAVVSALAERSTTSMKLSVTDMSEVRRIFIDNAQNSGTIKS